MNKVPSLKSERTMSSGEKRYNYLNITPLHSIEEDEETEFNSVGSEDSNNSNASSTGSINSSMSFISQHDPHQIMNSCEKLILKLLNDSQRLNSRLKKLELRAGLVEDQLPSFQRCASFPQTITEHPSEAECSSDMATVNYP
ncbi:uncharacterized protein LOC134819649 isoform X2 [Bolinopsis microptera]|uniref:uncharacterized protein LOC134819649 isoform X2 n=1 Tax=Bolinopsis microptera TaxID=2820187 RepID=UPI00307A47D5